MRKSIGLGVLVMALLSLSPPVAAEETAKPIPAPPYEVSHFQSAHVTARFSAPFSTRPEAICFNLYFQGDLLDPLEEIFVGWFPIQGASLAIGVANPGPEPLRRVRMCHSQVVDSFMDGRQDFDILMERTGRVRVGRMTVTAIQG